MTKKIIKEETSEQYHNFCEKLLIEEIIKEFNFNCKLTFVRKIRFGGSNLTTYYFIDELGIEWSRDIPDKVWFKIASQSPKMRARYC